MIAQTIEAPCLGQGVNKAKLIDYLNKEESRWPLSQRGESI